MLDKRSAGSSSALRAFGAVVQLIMIADQRRPAEQPVEKLTDEHLQQELLAVFVDLWPEVTAEKVDV